MRQRFHADRRIKAVEPLLFERIPPQPSMLVHRPSDHVAIRPLSEPSAPPYRVLDEDTPIPRVHLLGNGRYALMITNSGAGYSRWRDFDITRWRADSTRDNWGMFFYLREEESNHGLVGDPSAVECERSASTRRSSAQIAPNSGGAGGGIESHRRSDGVAGRRCGNSPHYADQPWFAHAEAGIDQRRRIEPCSPRRGSCASGLQQAVHTDRGASRTAGAACMAPAPFR